MAGRYRVEKLLGEGGMAKVYRACHIELDRLVALKVLRSSSSTLDERKRFLREARLTARLVHANLVTLLDFGDLGGEGDARDFFLAFEYLQGQTLWDRLTQKGPMRAVDVARHAVGMSRGLRAAHANGIVHRDLKPDNVMLVPTPDGEVLKLIDFGLGNFFRGEDGEPQSDVGLLVGTPEYMAPEAAKGGPVDERVDVYALGCLLYELLAGDPPFHEELGAQTLSKHLHAPVPPLRSTCATCDASEPFELLLRAMLEKRPEDRPASMSDVLARLARLPELEGERDVAPEDGAVRIGRYVGGERLAEGADTVVWSGTNSTLGTRVVIKWFRGPGLVIDQAQRLARCRAPGLARILDAGRAPPPGDTEPKPYVVFEQQPLLQLSQVVRDDGALEVAEAVRLGVTLAEALAELHQNNLLHGRVSDTNILVDPVDPGSGMLIGYDLGRANAPAGTRRSEFVRGSQVSDVRALATVLYDGLLGTKKQSAFRDLVARTATRGSLFRMEGSRLPDPVARILARALAISHPQAITTAAALADELASVAVDAPAPVVISPTEVLKIDLLGDRPKDVWVLGDDNIFATGALRSAFDALPADLDVRRISLERRFDVADRLRRDETPAPWVVVFGLRTLTDRDPVLEALRATGETARILLVANEAGMADAMRELQTTFGAFDRLVLARDAETDLAPSILRATAELARRRNRYDVLRAALARKK